MERVRQCPYKTSFLCYFLEFAPLFYFLNKKIKFSNSREFCIFKVTDATTSATYVKK
jgi:hypothetical protein